MRVIGSHVDVHEVFGASDPPEEKSGPLDKTGIEKE